MIVSQFTSLGASCELGLVQRHCDCEPLGLFRFGLTPLNGLISALDCEFAGIGDTSEIGIRVNRRKEYITEHRQFGFESHTNMVTDKVTEQQVRDRVRKHFQYLANLLMEDLRSGAKLLVYRPERPDAPAADRARLLDSIRRYGPSTLLWIEQTSDPDLIGTVRWDVCDELMVGHIDRYAPIRFAAGASFDVWLGVCNSALELRSRPAAV